MTGKAGNAAMQSDDNGQYRSLRPVTESEFSLFQKLIYQQAGIFLPPVKQLLLNGRLSRRIRQLGLTTFKQYYEYVCGDRSGAEMALMLDAVTTNETHFFREPRHFDFLEQIAYPHWMQRAQAGARPRQLRFWSAACSTGEEPYSLAMSMLERFPADSGWTLDILASDIAHSVLQTARDGLWPIKRAQEIPEPLLKKYMLKGIAEQTGKMKASKLVRAPLRFEHINLNEERYPVGKGLDAIFCRNVLIYFDRESRQRVVSRMLDLLAPDGLLFLGHAESLNGMNDRVISLAPAVYTLNTPLAMPRMPR